MRSASSTSTLSFRHWRQRILSRVFVHVGVAIGGGVLARLLATVTQVVLARLMTVADFGAYTSVYTLLGPVVMIAGLGLDTWLLRQGGNIASLNETINQVFSLRLLVSGVLMAVGVVAVLASGQPDLTLAIVLAAALGQICELMLTTAHTALRAQVRNWAAALLQVSVAVLMLLLIWLFWNSQVPVLTAAWFRLLSGAAGVALVAWLLRPHLHLVWRPAQLLPMVRQARIYFISDILANVALKADLTMVALLLGALAAGIYSPVLVIVNTTFLVPQVAWQVLLPIIARPGRDRRSLGRIVGLTAAGSLIYGLFWAGVLFWGAEWVMHLIYGAKYHEGIPLLQIMSLIPLLKSFNFCWATLMVAHDRQVLRTKLQAIGSVVNVLGNLVCIPLFGVAGAAWVNLSTEMILFICYACGVWMTFRLPRASR